MKNYAYEYAQPLRRFSIGHGRVQIRGIDLFALPATINHEKIFTLIIEV